MNSNNIPETIPNWINGEECAAVSGKTFEKLSPHSGQNLCQVARSNEDDVKIAIQAARKAQAAWADITPVQRGDMLHEITLAMRNNREEIATIVAAETGMSLKAALGETGGAIAEGEFMAGEGRRFYGRTTTSAVPNKYAMTVRQPLGVAGLIIAANTPIANVAWKVFPALVVRQYCRIESRRRYTGHGLVFRPDCPRSRSAAGGSQCYSGIRRRKPVLLWSPTRTWMLSVLPDLLQWVARSHQSPVNGWPKCPWS